MHLSRKLLVSEPRQSGRGRGGFFLGGGDDDGDAAMKRRRGLAAAGVRGRWAVLPFGAYAGHLHGHSSVAYNRENKQTIWTLIAFLKRRKDH